MNVDGVNPQLAASMRLAMHFLAPPPKESPAYTQRARDNYDAAMARYNADDEQFADRDDDVLHTFDVLCPDAHVAVAALHAKDGAMEWQYFDSHRAAAAWVHQLPPTVKAVYTPLNPYCKTSDGPGVAAADVTRRDWLLLDCDPTRERRSNATDDELGLARDVAMKIVAHLTSRGWPEPLRADSGNGVHLLYRIDLPNDDASTGLITGILTSLAKFSTPGVTVDLSTGDASQLTKVYGTVARKGPSSETRPHRVSALTHIPARLDIVPRALLDALPDHTPTPTKVSASTSLYDREAILAKLEVFSTRERASYTEYQIRCPWADEHSDPDSEHGTIFTWSRDGAPGFTCPHAHCAQRTWETFRDYLGIRPRHDVLAEFQHFFVTQLGSKNGGRLVTLVGCDKQFPPSFQTFEAFRQFYTDTPIVIGKRRTTRAQLWLEHAKHRKYTDVQFLPPPLPVPPGVLNLWDGFAVASDTEPYPERRCARFLAHVREVVCAGERPNVAEFLLDVLAHKVQQPASLTEVSIAMRGDQGIGKNVTTDYYGALFGHHAATVDKAELVTGRFNAVLSSKLVLVLDEAMWPGHKEFVGALKSLVTNTFLMIEYKGVDPVREPNFVQMFVSTNRDWVWPTSLGDRRALILDVSDARKGDIEYFAALIHERDHGGLQALLAFLQQRTVTHNLRLVPHTKARDKQIALTDDDPVQSLWFEMLYRGVTWPEGDVWDDFISTKDLEEFYAERCRATRQKPMPTRLLLARWHELLPLVQLGQRRVVDRELILAARRARGGWQRDKDGIEVLPDKASRRGTLLPSLETCRTYYARTVEGRDMDWPTPVTPEPPEPGPEY